MEYLIKLSSKDVSLNGKPLEEERRKEEKRLLWSDNAPPNMAEYLESHILSKQELEKALLSSVLQKAMSENNTPAKLYEIMSLAADINDCEGSFRIKVSDLDDYIRKAIENLEAKEKPGWWINMANLFKQINSPEEIKAETPKKGEA